MLSGIKRDTGKSVCECLTTMKCKRLQYFTGITLLESIEIMCGEGNKLLYVIGNIKHLFKRIPT